MKTESLVEEGEALGEMKANFVQEEVALEAVKTDSNAQVFPEEEVLEVVKMEDHAQDLQEGVALIDVITLRMKGTLQMKTIKTVIGLQLKVDLLAVKMDSKTEDFQEEVVLIMGIQGLAQGDDEAEEVIILMITALEEKEMILESRKRPPLLQTTSKGASRWGSSMASGDGSGRHGFGGRGGYRGKNEDVGFESGSGQEGNDRGEDQGPKVTYIPPPPPETEEDIFKHYQTGINFDKYEEIIVDVSGNNVPLAIQTFEEANLCDTLNKNISRAGYVKLTPIQKYSIPIIMAGRDLMACAQTGSGKTAAFLLPILAHMMNEGIAASHFKDLQEPEAIIVAPTRELINQIYLDARKFAFGTCVRPVVVYGGTQTGHSLRQIFQGCNILCATPGRLLDIINREKIGLGKVKFLILDEADRMLDMGFAPDIHKLIGNPNMPSKEDRQTLMFSATFPKEIQRMAIDILKPDYLFVVVGQVGGACSDVEQSILEVVQYDKKTKLLEILQNTGNDRTMVFVKTKKSADFLATVLCQEHIVTTSIHGDRLQRERESAIFDFRSGKCPVIVATSVAARGLDIENVKQVINYDLPSEIDEYVHRIGRTGRCGNIGKAISFFDPSSDENRGIARSLVKVLTDAHQEVPPFLEEIAYSAHGTLAFNPQAKTVDDRKTFAPQMSSGGIPDNVEEDWG
ncbi:putative ATP-dependent RNA helicase DDX4 [Pelodytes ibericus]